MNIDDFLAAPLSEFVSLIDHEASVMAARWDADRSYPAYILGNGRDFDQFAFRFVEAAGGRCCGYGTVWTEGLQFTPGHNHLLRPMSDCPDLVLCQSFCVDFLALVEMATIVLNTFEVRNIEVCTLDIGRQTERKLAEYFEGRFRGKLSVCRGVSGEQVECSDSRVTTFYDVLEKAVGPRPSKVPLIFRDRRRRRS